MTTTPKITTVEAADWLRRPATITTTLDLEELWLSRDYVGVRVMHTTGCVGDILAPSVDMPDGDIRYECSQCDHATGGESQRGELRANSRLQVAQVRAYAA